jgi:hypothetical protein
MHRDASGGMREGQGKVALGMGSAADTAPLQHRRRVLLKPWRYFGRVGSVEPSDRNHIYGIFALFLDSSDVLCGARHPSNNHAVSDGFNDGFAGLFGATKVRNCELGALPVDAKFVGEKNFGLDLRK